MHAATRAPLFPDLALIAILRLGIAMVAARENLEEVVTHAEFVRHLT
jgi:hypothetical protein